MTDEDRIYLDMIMACEQHNEETLERLALRPIDSHFIYEFQSTSANPMSFVLCCELTTAMRMKLWKGRV